MILSLSVAALCGVVFSNQYNRIRLRKWCRRRWPFNRRRPLPQLWQDQRGQDVAEYAVMLALVLVLVVGTVKLIGGNANNAFSQVASSMSSN